MQSYIYLFWIDRAFNIKSILHSMRKELLHEIFSTLEFIIFLYVFIKLIYIFNYSFSFFKVIALILIFI